MKLGRVAISENGNGLSGKKQRPPCSYHGGQLGVILSQPSDVAILLLWFRWRARMTSLSFFDSNCVSEVSVTTVSPNWDTYGKGILKLERYIFLRHHLAQIDQAITHTAKRCIDAAIC